MTHSDSRQIRRISAVGGVFLLSHPLKLLPLIDASETLWELVSVGSEVLDIHFQTGQERISKSVAVPSSLL